MWTHPSDAQLMDVLDGTAADRVLAHVAGCDRCRHEAEKARSALALTAQAAIPDPAPAYWGVLRRQVARGLEAPPAPRWPRPLWAAALAGATLVALLIAVPASRAPIAPAPTAGGGALPAWSALPPAEDDPGLPVLEQVAPVAAAFAPALECSDLAECVVALTDEESGDLADAIRHELGPEKTL